MPRKKSVKKEEEAVVTEEPKAEEIVEEAEEKVAEVSLPIEAELGAPAIAGVRFLRSGRLVASCSKPRNTQVLSVDASKPLKIKIYQ